MVSLAALIPDAKTGSVTLPNGSVVTVYPLTVRHIGKLIADFPAINRLLAGKEANAAAFIADAPEAFIRIALAALRVDNPDDPAEQEAVAALPLDTLTVLLHEIIKTSLPRGLVPFVDSLSGLLSAGGAPAGGTGTGAATT